LTVMHATGLEVQPQSTDPFSDLRHLIHYNLDALAVKKDTPVPAQLIHDFEGLVSRAAEQAREKLEDMVLLQKQADDALTYALCRRELIRLAESLLRYATPEQLLTPDRPEPPAVVIAQKLYQEIDGLFEFIDARFAPPEPTDTSLTDRFRRMVQARLAQGFKTLMEDLEQEGTDPTLLTIIQYPYNQARDYTNGNYLTYRKANYLLSLKKALAEILEHPHTDMTDTVMDTLFRFDFNHPSFFRYCLKIMDLDLESCKTSADRLHGLQGYCRRVHNATTLRGRACWKKKSRC